VVESLDPDRLCGRLLCKASWRPRLNLELHNICCTHITPQRPVTARLPVIANTLVDGRLGEGGPCGLRYGGAKDLYSTVPTIYTASMSKHLVDIDNELLAEATSILGASTMKEAVNRSLESVVLAARRRSHADRLGTMAGLDLDDSSVMSGAWR
jgi:Arc/MetJ family transcription regulator